VADELDGIFDLDDDGEGWGVAAPPGSGQEVRGEDSAGQTAPTQTASPTETLVVKGGPYAGETARPVTRIGMPGNPGGEHVWLELVRPGEANPYRFRSPVAKFTGRDLEVVMAVPNATETLKARAEQRAAGEETT